MKPLSNIAVTLDDRKWMKAAKAWRLFFRLPVGNSLEPALLSGMIDQQCRAEFSYGTTLVVIDPAHIIDVPTKSGAFQVVLENCYEHQNNIAYSVTDLVGKECQLSILPRSSEPQPAVCNQPIEPQYQQQDPTVEEFEKAIKGLHILFGKNNIQEFVINEYNRRNPNCKITTITPAACKAAFKDMAGVESCNGLTMEFIRNWHKELSAWLNRRPS